MFVCGSQPVGHFHANHSVARGKTHRRILQRAGDIRRSAFAGETFARHEQEHGTRSWLRGILGCHRRDVQHVEIVFAILQAAGKRHALAGLCLVRGGFSRRGAGLLEHQPDLHDRNRIAIRRGLGTANRNTRRKQETKQETQCEISCHHKPCTTERCSKLSTRSDRPSTIRIFGDLTAGPPE